MSERTVSANMAVGYTQHINRGVVVLLDKVNVLTMARIYRLYVHHRNL